MVDRCVRALPAAAAAILMLVCPTQAASPSPEWHPWIELGGRVSNERVLGETNLFAPLWQNPTALLFADVRGMLDDNDAREGNFGLGYRRMLDNGWNLGAYGYFDIRRSANDNTFHQVTLGVEALSRDLDLRANVYLPVGDSEARMDLGTSTNTVITTSDAFIAGDGSLDIDTQFATSTTTGEIVEKALGGVDGEIGVRVPVFDLESGLDLRAYAGGYWFDASGVDEIAGPRGRLELTAHDFGGLPGVRLTAGLTVQHDRVRDEQIIGNARLRLPLQSPASADNAAPLTYMERRMTDAVVRDVDIVSNTRDVSTSTASTEIVTEDAINTWNGEDVTSVAQVDGENGQAALQAALDGAGIGGVVIANGEFDVAIQTNVAEAVTLLGGGTDLRVRGEETGVEIDYTAAGNAGEIGGNVVGAVIQLTDSSVVGGMTVTNTGDGARGIRMQDATGAVAYGNRVTTDGFTNSSPIISIASDESRIYGNVVSGPGFGSIIINTSNDAEVIGNTASSIDSFGIRVVGSTRALIEDNVFTSENSVSASFGISSDILFTNNTFSVDNGDVLVGADGSVSFLPGSTGNVDLSGATRCDFSGPGSGTVVFEDGNDCSF